MLKRREVIRRSRPFISSQWKQDVYLLHILQDWSRQLLRTIVYWRGQKLWFWPPKYVCQVWFTKVSEQTQHTGGNVDPSLFSSTSAFLFSIQIFPQPEMHICPGCWLLSVSNYAYTVYNIIDLVAANSSAAKDDVSLQSSAGIDLIISTMKIALPIIQIGVQRGKTVDNGMPRSHAVTYLFLYIGVTIVTIGLISYNTSLT